MIRDHILIAVGSIAVGVVIAVLVLAMAVQMGIDINENLWVLAIPTVIALILNIIALELYRKFKGKKK